MKVILFIHHGDMAGGAPLSLLYTIQGISKRGYIPIIALGYPSPELHNLYNQYGFKTIELKEIIGLTTWSGSEGRWYNPYTIYYVLKLIWFWKKSHIALEKILQKENIDLVHLNSSVLYDPAAYLTKQKFPFIWHVREYAPNHKGIRFRFISNLMKKTKGTIFLSASEKKSWVGNDCENGNIVHNFIDFNYFQSKQYQLSKGTKNLLYTGGLKKHKGFETLLKALILLDREFDDLKCFFLDTDILEFEAYLKSNFSFNEVLVLSKICVCRKFVSDIREYFSDCDILLFPAIVPHFARPIVEAAAMKRPSIASRFDVLQEILIDGETGLLFEPNNFVELAEKIRILLVNPKLIEKMGLNGYELAQKEFNVISQIEKITKLYESLLQNNDIN